MAHSGFLGYFDLSFLSNRLKTLNIYLVQRQEDDCFSSSSQPTVALPLMFGKGNASFSLSDARACCVFSELTL